MRNRNDDIRVIVRNVASSASKVQMVINTVRKKSAKDALSLLRFCPRKELAIVVSKAINSGLDRAQKAGMDLEKLHVTTICANQGPTLKRFMPRAQGRAFKIRHRTSSITLTLNELAAN